MIKQAKVQLFGMLPVKAARTLVGYSSASDEQPTTGQRQLLVDVSIISHSDARTGIQRVVRGILGALLTAPPEGWRICPVVATRKRSYHYTVDFPGRPEGWQMTDAGKPVRVAAGDVFLGLDLAANILPHRYKDLMLWKAEGVKLHFVVYDLLPVLYPDWFNDKTRTNIEKWLKTLAIFADGLICISSTVKDDLVRWLDQRYGLPAGAIPISSIPLGADIEATIPNAGLPDEALELLALRQKGPAILMVGTVEPRKGYAQALASFEKLWEAGEQVSLVIVGKPGWKTDQLQGRIRNHGEFNRRLFWFDNASDELLLVLYHEADGVLLASEAEGFGLPLIEAARHGKPILARDIPAFREMTLPNLTFFSGREPQLLSECLGDWLHNLTLNPSRVHRKVPVSTWHDSMTQLHHCIVMIEERTP